MQIADTTKTALATGIGLLLQEVQDRIGGHEEHFRETPDRVVRAYQELFSGVGQDAGLVLKTGFEEKNYDQMIHIGDIDYVSVCAHHLLPFYGKVHFAYIPYQRVVGLSKVPRMVEILSRRPQIQEQFTEQIVETFYNVVQPKGCAVMVEGMHSCSAIRGIRKSVTMRTTALRGYFLEKAEVKEEFLLSLRK